MVLGVLGILQALALELLWEQGVGGLDHWQAIGALATGVLQVTGMFLGVVVIWLMYASLVMRYRWVPHFQDLVFPFVLGVLEFGLIGLMGPDRVGAFLLLLAFVFLVSSATNYGIYQRVLRQHPERGSMSAGRVGYGPAATNVLLLPPAAGLAAFFGPASWVTTLCLLGANVGLVAQIGVFARFWQESMAKRDAD